MKTKMYVDVNEVCEDWGCSRTMGYRIIADLNKRMLQRNPNLIVIHGKCNRKWYLENCYGAVNEADAS